MLTWCDGLADVDLGRLLACHRGHRRPATPTAVHPPARFGRLSLDGGRVIEFEEKRVLECEWSTAPASCLDGMGSNRRRVPLTGNEG
jgi:glucose-1-phosphate cytidylyltransferase